MRKLLVVFLLLSITSAVFSAFVAKAGALPPVPVKMDSAKVQVRNFNSEKVKAYRTERAFVYDSAAPVNDSFWDRFVRWFWDVINNILNNKVSGGLLKYMAAVAFLALVVFVIMKVTGLDLKVIVGKSKSIAVPYTEVPDNIHEINFNEEIEKAISIGNYRLAVRLFYLNTLKKLSDRNLIGWQPDKTNQAYVEEITDPQRKNQFAALTMQFEYVWYGEFFIDKDSFNELKANFDRFNTGRS